MPCFATIYDAQSFLQSLRASDEFQEEKIALQLQLLLPAKSSALISARWNDFSPQLNNWYVRKQQKEAGNINQPLIRVYISDAAKKILLELNKITGSAERLFPQLSALKRKGEAEKKIAKMAEEVWNKYPINPNHFPSFFKKMALDHSYFRVELIDKITTHKPSSLEKGIISSYSQEVSICEWWGDALQFGMISGKF